MINKRVKNLLNIKDQRKDRSHRKVKKLLTRVEMQEIKNLLGM